MRLSIEWISEYIKVLKSPAELSKQIKLHTTNVESVQAVSRDLCNVIVGKVEQVQKHPDADKLIVCRVNMGNEYKQILTADLSVKEGDVIPVAVNGAKLASGMEIKDRKMRGIESQGMFCSLSELGLEEKSDGVYKLKEEVPLGTDFIEYFKLKDDIVEIEVFPNRPDLLSYIGAAKELQVIKAAEGFKLPEYDELSRTDTFDVSINYEGCKRYTALEMKNIKVGSSPLWLVRRLAACGIRSINNIVDITNYVMLESGHPVHAFDLDVIGRKIVVRKAQKGEKTVLLDEKEYELNGTETLITGEKGILALGGVMGCQNSGITSETRNILLEVAYFDPVITRKSAKYHKLSTDASYRFERGVDPNDAMFVMGRLAYLIKTIACGTVHEGVTDVYPIVEMSKCIHLRKWYVDERLGKVIPIEEIESILGRYGFEYKVQGDGWDITVPTKRPDLSIEEDLVEEVARAYGYYNISSALPVVKMFKGSKSEFFSFKDDAAYTLRQEGYHEAMTYSMMNIKNMWMDKSDIRILNPLSAEYEYMRPILVYGILESASYNFRNQNKDIKLFEIGKTFVRNSSFDTGIKETTKAAIVACGRENPYDYTDKREVSFFTVKGAVEGLFESLNLSARYERAEITGLSKAQSADIFIGDKKIGFMGLLEKDISDKLYDIKSSVYIAEIDMDMLYEMKKPISKKLKTFDYPAIKREYSFIAPVQAKFEDIRGIIQSSGKIIESINIFDIYKGKGIDPDKMSITITIVYRSFEKTLTDEDVNKVESKMLTKLSQMEVVLRGA